MVWSRHRTDRAGFLPDQLQRHARALELLVDPGGVQAVLGSG